MNNQNNQNFENSYSDHNGLIQIFNYDFSRPDSNSSFTPVKPLENKAEIVEKLINFLKTD
ncbi:MAG: hypothetical protein BGO78_17580 [Chloroflexi bacterium 44-23]|nr:MAG: hypothetical protein BGO78_17580 [Chloroflexi bacterium 44-23]